MKIFECSHCFHPIFFENDTCENCNHKVGYLAPSFKMISLGPSNPQQAYSLITDGEYKFCKNHEHDVCNWLIPLNSENNYCTACQLNRTIPNLSDSRNYEKWQKLEIAKHRLIYQLQILNLSINPKMKYPVTGLCFDFIAKRGDVNIMTGHSNGVVTIILAEADSVHREMVRKQLSESYRTLIGHFRHEIGHYFWESLIQPNPEKLNEFRGLFGDEQKNYGQSLATYYQYGAPFNWQNEFISQYASSHPWENWAETWAHYLHIMDTTETAYYCGLKVSQNLSNADYMHSNPNFDPYHCQNFDLILNTCIPLFSAVNNINRSMGMADVYPFVVSPSVIQKMKFIHNLLQSRN
jgi:hypothetical protein